MKVELQRDYCVFTFACGDVIGQENVLRASIRTALGLQIVAQAKGWRDFLFVRETGLCYSADEIGDMFAEVKKLEVTDRLVVIHRHPPAHQPGDWKRN